MSWKSLLRAAYLNDNSFFAFFGSISSATGGVTFLMMRIGRFGWDATSYETRLFLEVKGVGLFSCFLFS